MQTKRASARASTRTALLAGAVVALTALTAQPAAAASSKGCVNGGFSLVGQNRTVSGPTDAAIPAADLGPDHGGHRQGGPRHLARRQRGCR